MSSGKLHVLAVDSYLDLLCGVCQAFTNNGNSCGNYFETKTLSIRSDKDLRMQSNDELFAVDDYFEFRVLLKHLKMKY